MHSQSQQQRDLRLAFRDWLSSPELDVFATVTLRQSRKTPSGQTIWLTPEQIIRTAWILRDRLKKKLLSASAIRNGSAVAYLPFREGNGVDKRYHLHILTVKPPAIPQNEYRSLFVDVACRLDWVYDEIDIRFLEQQHEGENERVISYSLKEGADAFIPEAACVPIR